MLALLANYKEVLAALFIALIVFFMVYIKILKEERDNAIQKNTSLTLILSEQNAAITKMQLEAKKSQNQLLQAESKASQQAKIDQVALNKILNSKVPHDCNGAIKWGAVQSAKIAKYFV